jgi:PAS domain S-box-containing protein
MEKLNLETHPKLSKLQYCKSLIETFKQKAKYNNRGISDKKLIANLRAEVGLLTFKFKAVFANPHNHYILLDEDLNIVDYNHRASVLIKSLFGKILYIGEPLLKFLHPESAATVAANCKRTLAGESFEVERKIVSANGKITWWMFEYSPAYNRKNVISGITFNARDITLKKRYEEKLEQQHKTLRAISLGHSHDIRGPVCSIMGIITIIKENDYKADLQCLKFIETAVETLDQNTRKIVNNAQTMGD